MANFKLNQTGEQIQADLNLIDSNNATEGQVLTANGTGGASWQNATTKKFYLHTIVTSAYTFYVVNKFDSQYSPNTKQATALLNSIAFNRLIGYSFQNRFYAYDISIAIDNGFGDLTAYINSPSIIQKGNAISYFGTDGQEVTILSSNFGEFVSDTVTETMLF